MNQGCFSDRISGARGSFGLPLRWRLPQAAGDPEFVGGYSNTRYSIRTNASGPFRIEASFGTNRSATAGHIILSLTRALKIKDSFTTTAQLRRKAHSCWPARAACFDLKTICCLAQHYNRRMPVPRATRWGFLTTALLASSVVTHAAYPANLRSPWDAQTIAVTDAPYTCPAPPPFSKSLDVEGYYSDAHHSVVDPKRFKAQASAFFADLYGCWFSIVCIQHGGVWKP